MKKKGNGCIESITTKPEDPINTRTRYGDHFAHTKCDRNEKSSATHHVRTYIFFIMKNYQGPTSISSSRRLLE